MNCPEGAREATLGCAAFGPRNDVVILTQSFFWWCGPDTPGGVSLRGSLRVGATLAVVPDLVLDIPKYLCYHIFNN